MTDQDNRRYRAAMQSEARALILALERRGLRFRLHGGRIQATPAARLTGDDRRALRAHAADVRVLVTQRADWFDWATRPAPRFDPSRAFLPGALTAAEVRGGPTMKRTA